MNKYEKAYCILFASYLFVYYVAILSKPIENPNLANGFTIANSLLAFGYYAIVIREIFKRQFPHPIQQVMWTVGMFIFWPVTVLYLWIYGFKPRWKY